MSPSRSQHDSIESLLARKAVQPHIFPATLVLKPWKMGPEFLSSCKNGVLNYVLLRPCTALIAFICESRDMYGEGELGNPLKAYFYLVFINSWSQGYAMYCLILLFKARFASHDLRFPHATR